jgi:hypothetical protein
MVRTFLKVYMDLGSSFLFLQEQIKDIIIVVYLINLASQILIHTQTPWRPRDLSLCVI